MGGSSSRGFPMPGAKSSPCWRSEGRSARRRVSLLSARAARTRSGRVAGRGARALAIDTLRDLAHLHADLGDLDAAVLTIDQALSIDPDPIEDLFRQQIIWQHRLGRGDAAQIRR